MFVTFRIKLHKHLIYWMLKLQNLPGQNSFTWRLRQHVLAKGHISSYS